MPDFEALGKRFKDVVKAVGIQKGELEEIVSSGGSAAKTKSALDKLAAASAKLERLMASALPKEERQRKIADLESRIELNDIILATETSFEARMKTRRRLTRLHASLTTLKSDVVFRFNHLLDDDGNELGALFEEADRDIRARQNLQRLRK